jgi:hypothetical protein
MAYLVRLTSRAQRDFAHLYSQIDAAHSDAALIWYRGFKEAILSLDRETQPMPRDARKRQAKALALRPQAPRLSRNISLPGKTEEG